MVQTISLSSTRDRELRKSRRDRALYRLKFVRLPPVPTCHTQLRCKGVKSPLHPRSSRLQFPENSCRQPTAKTAHQLSKTLLPGVRLLKDSPSLASLVVLDVSGQMETCHDSQLYLISNACGSKFVILPATSGKRCAVD